MTHQSKHARHEVKVPKPKAAPIRVSPRRLEAELHRTNRALRTISSCNQAMIRATSENGLLGEICRAIVEVGGYRLAWVGYAENDAAKTVRPMASAGYEAGYLETADITWADEPRGRGPTGTAIRSGAPAVCRDVHVDPRFEPWRADAIRRGYASSIVLPLKTAGNVLGAVSIYATEPDAFDQEEVTLLQELADDLVFGLLGLRTRDALRQAGAYNRRLLEASLDPLVTIGPDGKITDVNAATETVTGRSRAELTGTDFSDYFTEPGKARAGYQQVFRDGLVRDYLLDLRHRDGRIISVLYNASVYRDERGQVIGVFAAARDITERQRAEGALRRSEMEMREAQRLAHVGSWWLDSATNAVGWTEELYRMLGLDPALSPPPYTEHHRLFTPESWARLSTALPRTQETGVPYELELEMVRPDGSHGWMLARGEPLRDKEGVIVGLRGSAQDITERKRAEAALAASEKEFHSLAEAMPQIVWATRADGWNIYFNQRWVDYTGMTLEESYGPGWNKPFHPDDQQRSWEAWQQATRHGATYSLEVRLRRKDGVYRWWLIRGVPLQDADGKILKWFGTCTDIEELKKAEALLEQRVVERTASLRESEARFRQVAESLPQLVWTCAPDGLCDYLSPQWVRYTGKSEAEQLGYGWLEQLHPDDRQRTITQWQATASRGENFVVEFRIRRHDGTYRWFRTLAVALRDEAGKLIKWFGSNTDIDDLKRAEEAMHTSEDRMRSVLRATSTGTFEIDLKSGEGRWNDVEFELLGLKPGDVPAHPESFFHYVHPEDIKALGEKWEQAKNSGELDTEFRVVRADGQVRWLAGKGHFIQEHTAGGQTGGVDGEPARFLGINYDITARKQAEESLRVSEERNRLLFETTRQGVVYQDAAGRIIAMNPAAVRILGKTPEEFLGSTSVKEEHDTIREDGSVFPGVEHPSMVALHTGQEVHDVVMGVFNPRERAYRWININAVPRLRPGETEANQVYTIFDDVTERKRAEQALQESEQRLALAVHAAQEGIWDWDMASGRLTWSLEMFHMFGFDPAKAEASFEIWRSAIHPTDLEAAEARIQDAVRNHARLENEYRIILPTGEIRWINAMGDTSYAENGEPRRMSGVCLDITDRKRVELELQSLTSELKEANKELETFAYSVSHDLRAPLRAIDGFSRIVLEECAAKLDDEGRDNLRRVRAATQRMGELIDDLLKLSRAVRAEMWCGPLDLSTLARDTFANLHQAEPARQVECAVTPGLSATADRSLLRVVLENLLGNAWKFTGRQAGARIEVGALEGDGERVFFVRDNGAGFDPAYAGKLFAPFQRLHGQDEFPGHGIGLATVQRIIRRHGGRVWAEGRVNAGATFYFTLPAQPK